MIKAELRIGNWVDEYGTPTKIQRGEEIDFMPDVWKPIVLSPDILEKAGFKDGYINHRHGHFLVREFGTVTQGIFKGEYYLTIIEAVPHALNKRFQYFHQLQNLYFVLTGEELNIEL